jgi:cysteine-rich repeat protein
MQRVTVLAALGLLLFAGYANAQDCSRVGAPCSDQKYGMGSLPDFRRDTVPPDVFDGGPATITAPFNHDDFGPDFGGVSYGYSRADEANQVGPKCGRERGFLPLPGQILLREQDGCVPTSEGPTGEGGCRVEIPVTDGGKDDPATVSELYIFTIGGGFVPGFGTFDLSAATPNTWGGTSDPDDANCLAENVRLTPTLGTRYILPADRGGDGTAAGGTYVRWDSTAENRLRIHTDDPAVCCNSPSNTVCNLILPNQPEYPALAQGEACDEAAFLGGVFQVDGNVTPDWIFEGDKGTPFHSDSTFTLPGQSEGVCDDPDGFRDVSCTATGNGCAIFGEGVECDLSDRGVRVRPIAASDGSMNPDSCASFVYVVRGRPDEGCTILRRYETPGDPGDDCGVINYGVRPLYDADCDGNEDFTFDKCPQLNQWDEAADADGDCDGEDPFSCRGDECECGDQTSDGGVDINDILSSNTAIFGGTERRLCDGTGDVDCNVSDILAQNQEIFVRGSSTCRHVQLLSCGDGVIDPGETCDDGNQQNLDGCSSACQTEP